MPDEKDTFIDLVQLHERAWGAESYKGRPKLQQILSIPVVAFWYPVNFRRDERFTLTLHTNIEDIENYMLKLLLHTNTQPPPRRLYRLYLNGRRVSLKRVKIHLGLNEDQLTP